MDPDILACLREGRISTLRLGDMGVGSVGITLDPHFILGRDGARTGWLAKRLRASQFGDPAATFARFEREHRLVDRYFGAPPPSMVAESAFVVLDGWSSPGSTTQSREYVMVQEFVNGISLDEAATRFRAGELPWLGDEIHRFLDAYRHMQHEAMAVLDCFSTRSDHVKVDVRQRRVVLIDTNNLVSLRDELSCNAAFRSSGGGDPDSADAEVIARSLAMMQSSGEYDPARLATTRDPTFLRDARAIELLVRYFPAGGEDNFYVREVLAAFFP